MWHLSQIRHRKSSTCGSPVSSHPVIFPVPLEPNRAERTLKKRPRELRRPARLRRPDLVGRPLFSPHTHFTQPHPVSLENCTLLGSVPLLRRALQRLTLFPLRYIIKNTDQTRRVLIRMIQAESWHRTRIPRTGHGCRQHPSPCFGCRTTLHSRKTGVHGPFSITHSPCYRKEVTAAAHGVRSVCYTHTALGGRRSTSAVFCSVQVPKSWPPSPPGRRPGTKNRDLVQNKEREAIPWRTPRRRCSRSGR